MEALHYHNMHHNYKVDLLYSILLCYVSAQSSESDSAHSSPIPPNKLTTLTKVTDTGKHSKDTLATERQQHDGDLKPKEANIQKVNTYWVIIYVFSI